MKSEDCVTSHNEVILDLKETTVSTPINAKCMLDKAVQFSPDQVDETTSIRIPYQTAADHELYHSFQIKCCPPTQPTPQNRKSLQNEEAIEQVEEIFFPSQIEAKSLNTTGEEISHSTDKTGKTSPTELIPDDSCGTQCLYYTVQCCECTIL
jgi:23S rRNA maturation-related 3'-5' exoribonuclease YhaM